MGPESTSMTYPSGSDSSATNFVINTDSVSCPTSSNPSCSLKTSGCASSYTGTDITMSGNVISVDMKVMAA
jgi:hypothetical protein